MDSQKTRLASVISSSVIMCVDLEGIEPFYITKIFCKLWFSMVSFCITVLKQNPREREEKKHKKKNKEGNKELVEEIEKATDKKTTN